MAWLVEVPLKTGGVSYQVGWREPDRRNPYKRQFRDRSEAEAFRASKSVEFPGRRSGPAMAGRLTTKDRILNSIEHAASGCWIWQKRIGKDGYGFIAVRHGGKAKTALAHRVAYEELVGPIPQGLQLDHLCRTRACVNPEHLEPVTARENVHRSPIHSVNRGRVAGADPNLTCRKGHAFTDENTYMARGYRNCRKCRNEASARYQAKRKLTAGAS